MGGTRNWRVSKDDATYDGCWTEDAPTWRFFRHDPIRWRVLKVKGGIALVVSDVALDARRYNEEFTSVTWATSSVRSWLNGYGAESNQPGVDFVGRGFVDAAFSVGQRAAVLDTRVANVDSRRYGTYGGEGTTDRVFLLSEADVCGATATTHGFVADGGVCDEARRCEASDYARAMGAYRSDFGNSEGNCWWWLRSPGDGQINAAGVCLDGHVYRYGLSVRSGGAAVRPALNLDPSSSRNLICSSLSYGIASETTRTDTATWRMGLHHLCARSRHVRGRRTAWKAVRLWTGDCPDCRWLS